MASSEEGNSSSPTSGRHPMYRGIRCRRGKWVSEIREPGKTTRIWLGTYATPEMAAAAYDVAALALKGPQATINISALSPFYPLPLSLSAADIRAAAASAVAQSHAAAALPPAASGEYVDEEALLDMPKLLADMAEGMLLSPPHLKSDCDYSPEYDYPKNDSLWSYH